MPWLTPALALWGAILTAALAAPVLRRLAEPPDPAPDKVPYRALAGRWTAAAVGLTSAASGAVAYGLTPPAHWLTWTSLTTVGALAVVIDARTTYLPRTLARLGWLIAALGVAWACVCEGTARGAVAAILGAATLGGFFHLVWRFTGALGYGDVRLMATVGAVTGPEGLDTVMAAALCGTTVGAVWALAHRARTPRGTPFPYGPALWAGPFLALVAEALTSQRVWG